MMESFESLGLGLSAIAVVYVLYRVGAYAFLYVGARVLPWIRSR